MMGHLFGQIGRWKVRIGGLFLNNIDSPIRWDKFLSSFSPLCRSHRDQGESSELQNELEQARVAKAELYISNRTPALSMICFRRI